MNAVEIEEAVSLLAGQPFDAAEFPYSFLAAFDNKETAIARLRSGNTNASDIPGAVLQRNNIHIAVCEVGQVSRTLDILRGSPKTASAKAKFILATDGVSLEAEDVKGGESVAAEYSEFARHFGFFLPLAGITTVKEIKDNPIDVRATGRLNRLYVELVKTNPEWGKAERRHEMNHFMARLIFCFFAEDTGIFHSDKLFSATVEQMSASDGSNTAFVIGEIFRAMNTAIASRAQAGISSWADMFPYTNGGLFSGSLEAPAFTRVTRSYLAQVGALNWREINPDIFGSMIQAVADDGERSALGMHYTSVPNILKVLNPLFLDELRAELETAGKSAQKLRRLRERMSRIRVFDPACGSGNFLVIAYKQMRAIEAEANRRLGDPKRKSAIPKTNFRGIELRDFPAEIARLALIIAEFQCDELYRDRALALAEFLPLDKLNWITCGNALRLSWLEICPPTGTGVKLLADDLFETPLDQFEIDFENTGGETYVCGNPPYQGSVNQTPNQKEDMFNLFSRYIKAYKDLDYVACWLLKAAEYSETIKAASAFVTTNSVCQGEQVGMLWPIIFGKKQRISFAYTSFQWKNNAANNAGVSCIIIGMRSDRQGSSVLYAENTTRSTTCIGPYLIPESTTIVEKSTVQISGLSGMVSGNKATDGGNLILSKTEVKQLTQEYPNTKKIIKRLEGALEFIRGSSRWCFWIKDEDFSETNKIDFIAKRIKQVKEIRLKSRGKQANEAAKYPHRFVYTPHTNGPAILVPSVSSETREYLPCGYFDDRTVIVAPNLAMYNAPLWNMALIASRLHLVWIATVCGKLKTDFRYSNTLGWNTFPVPPLTIQNKADLTRCAEDILLAREAHFPATIAELYDPEKMPSNLRRAHDRNDELLEQIYIGRRFRNDTERLETLFSLYTEMTGASNIGAQKTKGE